MSNLNNHEKEKCPCCDYVMDDGICHPYLSTKEELESINIMEVEEETKRLRKEYENCLDLLNKAHQIRNEDALTDLMLIASYACIDKKINISSLKTFHLYCIERMKEIC